MPWNRANDRHLFRLMQFDFSSGGKILGSPPPVARIRAPRAVVGGEVGRSARQGDRGAVGRVVGQVSAPLMGTGPRAHRVMLDAKRKAQRRRKRLFLSYFARGWAFAHGVNRRPCQTCVRILAAGPVSRIAWQMSVHGTGLACVCAPARHAHPPRIPVSFPRERNPGCATRCERSFWA